VATYLGTLLVLDWRLGLAACATWVVTAAVTRMSSLSALVAVALTNLWVWLLGDSAMLGLSVVLSVLIYWKHWPNLQRIAAGSEPRIGAKR
jgi:glycerol-3-phosphate acyltransferase PlsY